MTFDVAIVGAGPAGAWAAYCLARRGARVVVFDPSHPREKPCGGGVTGRALELVAPALGAPLPHVAVRVARFETDGIAAAVPLPAHGLAPESALVVASRRAFDGALVNAAEHAGATLIAERAREVEVGAAGVTIRIRGGSWRAGWLIGADGANSLVRRTVGRPFSRAQLSLAAGYYAHGTSSAAIALRFESDPPGYLWSFPRPDHLAVGVCAQADTSGSGPLRRTVAAWLQHSGVVSGINHDVRLEPYAWPIPSLGPRDFAQERPAGPRWLLVGDAAGLVDPITREGISFALQSAAVCATAIETGDSAFYEAFLHSALYPELEHAARLKATFFQPWFTRLMVRAIESSAAVREVAADLVAGRQPYRGLRRRLLETFELGLAGRLLAQALAARRV